MKSQNILVRDTSFKIVDEASKVDPIRNTNEFHRAVKMRDIGD